MYCLPSCAIPELKKVSMGLSLPLDTRLEKVDESDLGSFTYRQ